MADDVLKLPGSSYDTVTKVIMAYSEVGKKTSLSAISQIMGTDQTVPSRNTGFLVSVGLLEGGRDKGPTAIGMKLGRALQFNEEEDIAAVWREVLVPHPLTQRILAAIRVRGGMDAATLQTQIVYTAGVSKSPNAMRGGGAVLEMLKASGLIAERDGKFTAVAQAELASGAFTREPEADEPDTEPIPQNAIHRVVESRIDGSGVSVVVNLDLRIELGVGDLRAVGAEIRDLLRQLREDSSGLEPDGTASVEQ